MAIKFACGACGRKFAARDEHAGRLTKCPGCGAEMVVPSGDPVDLAFEPSPSPQPPPVPADNPVAISRSRRHRPVIKAVGIVGVIVAMGAAAEGYARLRTASRATSPPAKNVVAARAPQLPPPPKAVPPKPQFDFTQWTLSGSLQWDYPEAECVVFSDDGRIVAVGGGLWRADPLPQGGYGEGIETGVTQLWEIASGEAHGRFAEPHDMIRNLAFLPSGNSLAMGDRRRIKVVDVKTGLTRYIINESGTSFIAINRARGFLANATSGYFWDIKNGGQRPCFVSATMERAAFSEDGRYLFTNGSIWDCESESRVAEIRAERAAFSHDNRFVGAANGVWATDGWNAVWADDGPGWAAGDWATGICFTPDDQHIIASSLSGSVAIRDSRTGRVQGRFSSLPRVNAMALSPDGQYLVTVGKIDREGESPIKIWRPAVKAAP